MTARPVVMRARATRDIDNAIEHYIGEGAPAASLGLVDALERAIAHISRHPAAGSPRYAHELNVPGLRAWPLSGYPYLLFYVERADHVDVWRMLHSQRDIPGWLQDPASPQLRARGES